MSDDFLAGALTMGVVNLILLVVYHVFTQIRIDKEIQNNTLLLKVWQETTVKVAETSTGSWYAGQPDELGNITLTKSPIGIDLGRGDSMTVIYEQGLDNPLFADEMGLGLNDYDPDN